MERMFAQTVEELKSQKVEKLKSRNTLAIWSNFLTTVHCVVSGGLLGNQESRNVENRLSPVFLNS